jgi:hypothetical protein
MEFGIGIFNDQQTHEVRSLEELVLLGKGDVNDELLLLGLGAGLGGSGGLQEQIERG